MFNIDISLLKPQVNVGQIRPVVVRYVDWIQNDHGVLSEYVKSMTNVL